LTIGTRSTNCANTDGGVSRKIELYRPLLSKKTVRAKIATPRRATLLADIKNSSASRNGGLVITQSKDFSGYGFIRKSRRSP
jgi:hypothetical protein